MRLILILVLSIWPPSVNAERPNPAIWEYTNCRNLGTPQNALNPQPKIPEWMRHSNLKCRGMSVFNIDKSKLTLAEFDSHWKNNGGPKLLESTLRRLENLPYYRDLPEEFVSNFEKLTAVSALSNMFGSYEEISKKLDSVDLFSDDEAATILVLGSHSERFRSNNALLLEVMLKRHFAQTGRAALPSVLDVIFQHSFSQGGSLERRDNSIVSLRQSKNYVEFILAAHELIEEGANEEIGRVKNLIMATNRITFLCPNLWDYISVNFSRSTSLRKPDFKTSQTCSKWYDQITADTAIKLEDLRNAFFSREKSLTPLIGEIKTPIKERIK